MRRSVSVFNRASRDAKTRQTGIHHISGSRDLEPCPDRVTSGARPKIEQKMGQRSRSSDAATGTQKRRGEKREKQRERKGREGWGRSRIRTRARLAMGAHDRRYKVDEAPFSTDQSAKRAGSRMSLFLLMVAELGKASPHRPPFCHGLRRWQRELHSRLRFAPAASRFCPGNVICELKQTECGDGSNASRGDARKRRRFHWKRWSMSCKTAGGLL